ncbi:MAG: c-type cytochrome [Chitinophagaceae bacterium]
MIFKNQLITTFVLALLTIGGIAAMKAPADGHKNLKILPADISDQKLDSIMESYSKALGVNCGFCHAAYKDSPDSLDFASDALPMKENARDMMKMTTTINKTYFYFDKTKKPEDLTVVRCMTCHHGVAYPVEEQ